LKIGLSQRILSYKGRAYDAIEHGWYSYLQGHTLFYLPNSTAQDFNQIADNLDSFIITGGDDSVLRRTVEIKLASAMMQRNKPVVGVCHGAFLLTELLGGTVVDVDLHMEQLHPVIYFGEVKIVNSFHNIAIDKLHDTGTVLCTDELGHVEAWIDGQLAGVVWHPERMDRPWLPDEIETLLFKENK
jgi:gamma-glutamyl-gamma-aminobutyrate hydrolase PuuD